VDFFEGLNLRIISYLGNSKMIQIAGLTSFLKMIVKISMIFMKAFRSEYCIFFTTCISHKNHHNHKNHFQKEAKQKLVHFSEIPIFITAKQYFYSFKRINVLIHINNVTHLLIRKPQFFT